MFKNNKRTAIMLTFIIAMIVSIKFFTEDNTSKGTIENNDRLYTYEEKYSEESTQVNETENSISKDEEVSKNVVIIKYQSQNESSKENAVTTENLNSKNIERNETTNESNQKGVVETKVSNNKQSVTSRSKNNQEIKKTTYTKKENTNSKVASEYKGYKTIGKIEIPKTGVDLPILEKTTLGGMEVAPCFSYSTGKLNQNGKTLILGHNYRNGKLFSNNYKLQKGDKIYVTTLDEKKVTYVIEKKYTTDPSDVDYLYEGNDDKPKIILSCCTNDEKNRIIIVAAANI